jgi:hypothetical protein
MEWRLFICSDCDTDGGVIILYVPEDRSSESNIGVPDFCLGCDSHLSYLNMGKVEVSGNPLVHIGMREPAEDMEHQVDA